MPIALMCCNRRRKKNRKLEQRSIIEEVSNRFPRNTIEKQQKLITILRNAFWYIYFSFVHSHDVCQQANRLCDANFLSTYILPIKTIYDPIKPIYVFFSKDSPISIKYVANAKMVIVSY